MAPIVTEAGKEQRSPERRQAIVRAPLMKITFWDDSFATYIAPQHVYFVQRYMKPIEKVRPCDSSGGKQMAYGEVVMPGGAFLIWDKAEADQIFRIMGVA